MNEIRSTELLAISTTGEARKLTQRLTNLCISTTAMRLLSYALVDFLQPHFTGNKTDLEASKKYILEYTKEKSNFFIQKLVTSCYEEILPRSLNGLYLDCNLDDPYDIATQEQNMCECK